MTESPKPTRLQFHVFLYPDDTAPEDVDTTDPDYAGTVTVTNQDQLLAETQAKGLGINLGEATKFHMTNLWIWAACVRRGLTDEKFKPFTKRLEYDPVKDEEEDPEDPTRTDPGASTG